MSDGRVVHAVLDGGAWVDNDYVVALCGARAKFLEPDCELPWPFDFMDLAVTSGKDVNCPGCLPFVLERTTERIKEQA